MTIRTYCSYYSDGNARLLPLLVLSQHSRTLACTYTRAHAHTPVRTCTNKHHQKATGGPAVLFEGGVGAAVSTAVGFYPWSLTYEYVGRKSPLATKNLLEVTDGLRRPPF